MNNDKESLNRVSGGSGKGFDKVEIFHPNAHKQALEVDENFSAPDALLKAQSLANLLDTSVKVPFVNFKVGLDSLVGLIPGIGDVVMLFASMRVVHLGHKLGVPKGLKYKMAINAVLDYLLGFIPIIGDIADMFFKANKRNVRIMEMWWVSENKDKIDLLAKRKLEAWQKEQDELQNT
jgi:hypothetical protein